MTIICKIDKKIKSKYRTYYFYNIKKYNENLLPTPIYDDNNTNTKINEEMLVKILLKKYYNNYLYK